MMLNQQEEQKLFDEIESGVNIEKNYALLGFDKKKKLKLPKNIIDKTSEYGKYYPKAFCIFLRPVSSGGASLLVGTILMDEKLKKFIIVHLNDAFFKKEFLDITFDFQPEWVISMFAKRLIESCDVESILGDNYFGPESIGSSMIVQPMCIGGVSWYKPTTSVDVATNEIQYLSMLKIKKEDLIVYELENTK